MKNRFSKFVPEKPNRKTIKNKIKYPEKPNRRENFLKKIYISLNECGYKINYFTVIILFSLYIAMFFFIGNSIISNAYFPKLPQSKSAKEILSKPEYETVKDGMEIIALKKLNLGSTLINILKKDKDINLKINSNAILSGKSLTNKEKEEISKRINEIKDELIKKILNESSNIPPMEINFSALNFSKETIAKELKQNSSNQKEITDKEIRNYANMKINQFYNNLKYTFNRYLLDNFRYEMIKEINPDYQKLLFDIAFGLIFVFIGISLFAVYFYDAIVNMSLRRMREDIPSWIQMFTNSIQAGYTLEQAFDFTKDKVKREPLLSIIKEITAQYKTYKNLNVALEPFSKWKDRISEVNLLVSTLKVQQKKGGNIVPVLYSLSKLISKRDLFAQKVESIASEAMGQLKTIFLLFFGIVLVAEKFFNFSKGSFSPFFSFCMKGGGFAGLFQVAFVHILLFSFSYAMWFIGSKIIKGEIKF